MRVRQDVLLSLALVAATPFVLNRGACSRLCVGRRAHNGIGPGNLALFRIAKRQRISPPAEVPHR